MPPNKKGGKNYKKGKHADDNPIIFERQPDQMYGRIIRLLGGCNAIVYCNDNRERLCHIRGSMRKKTWISVGDIVLISTRDLARRGDSVTERGDICAKYDPSVFERLKDRDRDINERLFTLIEKTDNAPNKNGRVRIWTTDSALFLIELKMKYAVEMNQISPINQKYKPLNPSPLSLK